MVELAEKGALDKSDRLGFAAGGTLYAVPTAAVLEVLRLRPVARVPHAPPSLLGVANLRGMILPVVSAACLLGGDQADATKASRILVLDQRPPCGLLVDSVKGMVDELARPFDAPALIEALVIREARPRRRSVAGETITVAPAARKREEPRLGLLGFTVAKQAYALPLDCIVEVLPSAAVPTRVVDADPAILGLVAHRRGVMPVVSLAHLLGHERGLDGGPLVVTRLSGGLVALAVDELRAILRVPLDRLHSVPPVLTRGSGETRIDRIARGEDGVLIAILSPAKLFDEATEARLANLADKHRQAETIEAVEEAREKFVVFKLGSEDYGLPIAAVDEVVRRPASLAPVPQSPAFVLGVMNLRGKPVPVFDGRSRFGAAEVSGASDRVVVVTTDGLRAGFAVDAVSEIIDVPAMAIAEAPDFVHAGEEGSFGTFRRIADYGGRLILLVEPQALLDRAERDAVAAAIEIKTTRTKARKPTAANA